MFSLAMMRNHHGYLGWMVDLVGYRYWIFGCFLGALFMDIYMDSLIGLFVNTCGPFSLVVLDYGFFLGFFLFRCCFPTLPSYQYLLPLHVALT